MPLEFIGLTFTNTEYFPSHIYVTVFIEFYNFKSLSYCLAEVNWSLIPKEYSSF